MEKLFITKYALTKGIIKIFTDNPDLMALQYPKHCFSEKKRRDRASRRYARG